jgi:hypothetical protein
MRPLNVPALALNIGPAVNVLGFVDRHGALSRTNLHRALVEVSLIHFSKQPSPPKQKTYALSS